MPEARTSHGIPAVILGDKSQEQHPVPLVDGAIDPSKIPDTIAFAVFFNTVSQ